MPGYGTSDRGPAPPTAARARCLTTSNTTRLTKMYGVEEN